MSDEIKGESRCGGKQRAAPARKVGNDPFATANRKPQPEPPEAA